MTPNQLKQKQKKLGYTNEKMAIALGVSRSTIYKWRSGESRITATAEILFRYLLSQHEAKA